MGKARRTLGSAMSVIAASLVGALLAVNCQDPASSTEVASYQASQATCPTCRIELEHVTTLGTADGPGGIVSPPSSIARDSRGRYYVVPSRQGETPIVFDPDGVFVARIGQSGEGPGEFELPDQVFVLPGDSLQIYDFNLGRVSVFDLEYVYVRSYDMRFSHAAMTQAADGTLLINQQVPTPAKIGYAVHKLGPEGEIEGSFDQYSPEMREPVWMRKIAAGRSGVWAVPYYHDHVIRLYDPITGELLRELRRNSEWYPTIDHWQIANPDTPPAPIMVGLWEDPDEAHVWTIGWAGDRDWRDHLGNPVNTVDGTLYPFDRNEGYDSVIEAVDAESGELVASARMDDPIWAIIEPGLIATFREDSVGWWYAEVFRVRLHRN